MKPRNYKYENVWFPVYAQELRQSIHDCDVVDAYSGFIYNPALNRRKHIEYIKDAEVECERRNAIIQQKEAVV